MNGPPAASAALGVAGAELVERHRRGDPKAFDEIYGQFGSMVFNLALRMAGDREEAADLSQETFLRVYRNLDGFRGRSSLKTWIYRVALNCCRSRLRRRQARAPVRRQASEEDLERLADSGRGPEERALAQDLGEQVGAALARVPRVFREAVVLRDLEGLSYDEIAAVLRVRIGTVRSRIARGRDHLRRLLEPSR